MLLFFIIIVDIIRHEKIEELIKKRGIKNMSKYLIEDVK